MSALWPPPKSWDDYAKDEKIAFLQSERRDLLAQARRRIHTAGAGAEWKRIDKIDRQITELSK